jgi:ParB-like chromosome segregation protein Spo0J
MLRTVGSKQQATSKGTVLNQPRVRLSPQANDGLTPPRHSRGYSTSGAPVTVPLMSIRPGESPRLNGEDKAHIARLAEIETPLPPILVNRRTMRVIDGKHRLMAASLQGKETIDVVFFDGSDTDVFLLAVRENVAHGLPLSLPDRRAAAERIVGTHPHMSDRAIGQAAGLSAKSVAAIRKRLSDEAPQFNARIGKDGVARPLDTSLGRRLAAKLLTDQPGATLREVARASGISAATVLDVRRRLQRGDSPVPAKLTSGFSQGRARGSAHGADAPAEDGAVAPAAPSVSRHSAAQGPTAAVQKLLQDPSLRDNEQGKEMLRLLQVNAIGAEQLPAMTSLIPPHCVGAIVQLSRHYARMWQQFSHELNERARIIDPR